MKKKKNLVNNPWAIGIGSSVFAVLILRIIDFVVGTVILHSIWNFVKSVFSVFVIPIELKLFWLILIFISGPVLGLLALWLLSLRSSNNISTNGSKWLSYRKDQFDGVIYRWEYDKGYDGKYSISNIIPFCTNCECQLVHERCPNCKTSFYNKTKPDYEIQPLIIHRAEKLK